MSSLFSSAYAQVFFKREPSNGWMVGTNHFLACEDLTLGEAR